MSRNVLFAITALMIAGELTPFPARAAAISDIMQVFVNGSPQCSATEMEPDTLGLVVITAISCGATTSPGVSIGNGGSTGPTILLEPGGSVSDVFGVIKDSSGVFDLAFASDTETTDASAFITDFVGSTPITMAEGSGGPFDATSYLSSGLQANKWTATFTSDSDAVPEPASVSVVLVLVGLGLVTWKRRETA